MSRLSSFGYNLKACFFLVFFLFLFFNNTVAQQDSLNKAAACKRLAIQSAQLSDQARYFAQQSYFDAHGEIFERNIDSAITCVDNAIMAIDSTLMFASDSAILALKYIRISKNFAMNAQRTLFEIKRADSFELKKELLKKTVYYSENSTIDAYHASFYFLPKKKKNENKIEQKDSIKNENVVKIDNKLDTGIVEKQVTKLDVDQSLFTLLKEDLDSKSEITKLAIGKLKNELLNTTDPSKMAKMKAQLSKLELKESDLEKKSIDAQNKLANINSLLEKNNKPSKKNSLPKDTIFSKKIKGVTDEWNKNFKSDSELPDFLIYQIQLGVFKSSVKPEIFKGLTPIYNKTTDKGIAYSIGLFEKMSDAQEAKKNVHNMGLKDAFIVAFYKQKKITLVEALKLEKK